MALLWTIRLNLIKRTMFWDIFCRVIDNHGDAGVCWRLAADLASRGEQVRLWIDDPSALRWMAPAGRAGVQVIRWTADAPVPEPGDVVIEAFGCELDAAFVAAMARRHARQALAWINLEYLTAEPFAERAHGLPSPVLAGPGAGLTKFFFYPGFTPRTGGLLREPDLAARQAGFNAPAWLHGLGLNEELDENTRPVRRISLFCYEPSALEALIAQWAQGSRSTQLLVAQGRGAQAVRTLLGARTQHGALRVHYLPWLSQVDFDHLLGSCDLNFVRGEDSLVRALWAGKPFVWQIYPQHDDAHHAKLRAFLDWMQAPPSLRRAHEFWNGIIPGTSQAALASLAALADQPTDQSTDNGWQATAKVARERLLAQDDLATQLMRFAARVSAPPA